MTIEEKLNEYDLFNNSMVKHGNLENIRDYEIVGYLLGQDFDLEVQYIFKGCIESHFKNIVEAKYFSMDERLLDLSKQDETDYPQTAFIWDAGTIVYPGWKLEENTDELDHLESLYNIKFHKIIIETNAYKLNLVFHDLEVNLLKRFEKQATGNFSNAELA